MIAHFLQTKEDRKSLARKGDINRQKDRKTDICVFIQTDRQTDRQIDRYIDRYMYRQIDRWIDRQIAH